MRQLTGTADAASLQVVHDVSNQLLRTYFKLSVSKPKTIQSKGTLKKKFSFFAHKEVGALSLSDLKSRCSLPS